MAGAIPSTDASCVRRTVQETILRLQRTSSNRHSLGHRYARSLRLFWRKSFRNKQTSENIPGRTSPTPGHGTTFRHSSVDASLRGEVGEGGLDPTYWNSLNSFSWRDLDSLGQFIENDILTGTTDGVLTTPEFIQERSSVVRDNLPVGFWNDVCDNHDFVF